MESTNKKNYYMLDLDNYNQPNGMISTINLTHEEFKELKKNYVYVYEEYAQALSRAMD